MADVLEGFPSEELPDSDALPFHSTVRISSADSGQSDLEMQGPDVDTSGEWGSVLKPCESFNDRSATSISRSRSAPMIPAQHSSTTSTWYTGPSLASSPSKQHWKALGSTWRDWDADMISRGQSRDANNKKDFIHGCVPNWQGQGTLRMKNLLEHELSWAYYRTRRHAGHPLREEVGETLDPKHVVGPMRSGGNIFQFWRDLRPPFAVLEVTRASHQKQEVLDATGRHQPHPDGDLFYVTYECAIEYFGERLWGLKSDGGTFNNKVHGNAQVRIPLDFPEGNHLRVASWGTPVVNWTPKDDKDPLVEPKTAVDPMIWMPIAEELGTRPSIKKLSSCREQSRLASRKADAFRKRGIQVPELQKLLLGPHADLPKLANAEHRQALGLPDAKRPMTGPVTPVTAGLPNARMTSTGPRKHRIYTASSGFVSYAG